LKTKTHPLNLFNLLDQHILECCGGKCSKSHPAKN
jgi:hypothetical protein